MSKRKLLRLVTEKHVNGWDDPRMPTISGFRRRGYTPEAIRAFAEEVGVAKRENVIDVALLEHSVRNHLNKMANRVMAVLRPLKVVIENYPENSTEWFESPNNPENPSAGTRSVPFSRELWIEQDDFMEEPPKKFFRLAPGREVRLRSAYFVTCTGVVKNDAGEITEVRCTYDPATKGGDAPDGRKPKATLHWVSASNAIDCEVRLYDRLFRSEFPEDAGDFLADINRESLEIIPHAKLEPSVKGASPETRYQFERLGYFVVDLDSTGEHPVFNRTVTLKDTWSKVAGRE
jgi:glutaminyl-tRNA synthetase